MNNCIDLMNKMRKREKLTFEELFRQKWEIS